jgi:hypothetical protein
MGIWQIGGGSSQDLVVVKPVAYPDLQKILPGLRNIHLYTIPNP